MLHATTSKAGVSKETYNTTTYEYYDVRNLYNIDINDNNNNNDDNDNTNNTLMYWLEDIIPEITLFD